MPSAMKEVVAQSRAVKFDREHIAVANAPNDRIAVLAFDASADAFNRIEIPEIENVLARLRVDPGHRRLASEPCEQPAQPSCPRVQGGARRNGAEREQHEPRSTPADLGIELEGACDYRGCKGAPAAVADDDDFVRAIGAHRGHDALRAGLDRASEAGGLAARERAEMRPMIVDLHDEPAIHEPAAADRNRDPRNQHQLEISEHRRELPARTRHADERAAADVVERPCKGARNLPPKQRLGHVGADEVLLAQELVAGEHLPVGRRRVDVPMREVSRIDLQRAHPRFERPDLQKALP